MTHTILGGLLVFGRQKLVEHAVERGEFTNFGVGNQINAVEPDAERFQAAQIAVIAEEVVQKTRGKTTPLRAAAGGHSADSRKQPVGMEPAFGNYFFHPL